MYHNMQLLLKDFHICLVRNHEFYRHINTLRKSKITKYTNVTAYQRIVIVPIKDSCSSLEKEHLTAWASAGEGNQVAFPPPPSPGIMDLMWSSNAVPPASKIRKVFYH